MVGGGGSLDSSSGSMDESSIRSQDSTSQVWPSCSFTGSELDRPVSCGGKTSPCSRKTVACMLWIFSASGFLKNLLAYLIQPIFTLNSFPISSETSEVVPTSLPVRLARLTQFVSLTS